MKANPVTTLITLALCLLISYAFYTFNNNVLKEVLSAGSFILLFTTLFFSIGARFSYYRTGINVRTTSLIFFVTFFVSNLVFSFLNFTQGAYIVVNGIALLLYFLIIYYFIYPARVN